MTDDERVVDPDLYEQMCQPFATVQEREKAEHAFHQAVRRLRKKHRIANVMLATATFYATDDGKLSINVAQSTCGDDLLMPTLAKGLHTDWQSRQERSMQIAALQRVPAPSGASGS